MKAKCIRNPSYVYVLVAFFFCGLLMVILPPVIELVGFQTDNAVYEAISFMPPTEPPDTIPVYATGNPKETEEPTERPAVRISTAASAEPVNRELPTAIPTPETTTILPNEEDQPAMNDPEPTPTVTEKTSPVITKRPLIVSTEAPATKAPATIKPTAEPRSSFEKLQEQNKDFVAWISIPGTPVDYPVVQSNDSDYYLNHLFTGEKSKLGCLFSLKNVNYKQPGRNIAIYGHHLSASDVMFGSLLNYKDPSYYEAHPIIRLYSLYHTSTYRIFAVLNMSVSDWDPATASFSGDTAFLQFVNRAQKNAMYGTDIAVESDDRILTLITCDRSYGGVSGRFIVMAVLEE